MPVVTPRKSARTIVPPVRLGDESPPRRKSPTNQYPPPQHDLFTEQSTVENNVAPNPLPTVEEVPVPTTEAVVNEDSSVSVSVDHHPCLNYSRRSLYEKWMTVKDNLSDTKLLVCTQARDLKLQKKEIASYERKVDRLETTERKYLQLSQEVHQVKVDKTVLCDRLRSANQNLKDLEASKKDLKDCIEGKCSIEEQRKSLIHQEQLAKAEHLHAVAKATSDVYAKSQEDKIKNLQEEINLLKTKAKQYDKIAQTATTTIIGLNAFHKRAKTR